MSCKQEWPNAQAAAAANGNALKAEIVTERGVPELTVNGQLQSRLYGRSTLPDNLALEKMVILDQADVRVLFINSPEFISLCWDGADDYDYTTYDNHVRKFAERHPNTKLILFVGSWMAAPWKWVDANPDDLVQFDHGVKWCVPSLGSAKWNRDAGEAIRRLVEHFENGPYADQVLGYNPTFFGNEWSIPDNWNGKHYADFSPAMALHFRAWLRQKYAKDDALREAWKDRDVTFETATIPSPEQRRTHTAGRTISGDGPFGSMVADYYRCLVEANTDRALSFAATIKAACNRRKLVTIMHGYSHFSPWGNAAFSNGDVPRLHGSPDIDLFHAPYSYFNRNFGRGCHYSMIAADNVVAHGKLMVSQSDTNTHQCAPEVNVWVDPPSDDRNAHTEWETLQVMKRDAAYTMQHHIGLYWLDGGPGKMFTWGGTGHGAARYYKFWYDSPAMKEMIGRLQQVQDQNRARGGERSAKVCTLKSWKSGFFQKCDQTLLNLLMIGFRNWILPRLGAPFDDYVLEDWDKVPEGYRLYIFLDAFDVSPELRRAIRARLAREGAAALWLYAPGFIDGDHESLEAMAELTGIKFSAVPDKDWAQIQLDCTSGHPLLAGVTEPEFGSDVDYREFSRDVNWFQFPKDREENYRLSPLFCTEDATVLGRYRGNGQPGLSVRTTGDGFTSLYCGAPCLPAGILKNLCAQMGIHLYTRDEHLVYAHEKFLGITFKSAGTHRIDLPAASDVTDCLSNEKIASGVKAFEVKVAYGETRLFWID